MTVSEFTESFTRMYGDRIIRIENAKNVSGVMGKYYSLLAARENLANIQENGEFEGTCGFGGTGTAEEAVEEIKKVETELKETKADELEDTEVFFITFDNVRSAIECSQAVLFPGGQSMVTRLAPFKDDIYYENLHMNDEVKYSLNIISIVMYIALIMLFTPLMGALQALAKLDEHVDLNFMGPYWKGLILGLVPVIIVSIFFSILPIILWYNVGMGLPVCKFDQEGLTLPRYADCLVGMGLLVSLFSGSIMGDMGSLGDSDKLAKMFGEDFPLQSTFFINYITNSALFGLGLELSGIVDIVFYSLFGTQEQAEMYFYIQYPLTILVFTICLTFSHVAPFVLLWGTVYFGLAYWIYKYRLLYVLKWNKKNFTWKRFPMVYNRLHTGLIICQIIGIFIFTVKEGAIQSILSIVLLIITIVIMSTGSREFSTYYEQPSLDTAVAFDKSASRKVYDATDDLFKAPVIAELEAPLSEITIDTKQSEAEAGDEDSFETEFNDLCTLLDKNYDSTLNIQEFFTLYPTGTLSFFDQLDTNQDGAIQTTELRQLFTNADGSEDIDAVKKLTFDVEFAALCNALDKDFSDSLNLQEFFTLYPTGTLSFFDQLNTNQDGEIQVSELRQMFILADGSGDTSTVCKLRKEIAEQGGATIDDEDFESAFGDLCTLTDVNEDGTFDMEEFCKLCPLGGGSIFESMETNKDGVLSIGEFRELFVLADESLDTPRALELIEEMKETKKMEFESAFGDLCTLIDVNEDGQLDMEEFRKLCPVGSGTIFESMDTNKDGVLSNEEFRELFVLADGSLDTPRALELIEEMKETKRMESPITE